MLPLYSSSSSSSSSKQGSRLSKWTKKWDRHLRTFKHQATLSSLILILILFGLTTFTLYHYVFLYLSSPTLAAPPPPPPIVPPLPTEPPKAEQQMNIVSQDNKEAKQIQIELEDDSGEKREKIKAAFVHSYGGYIKYAFGSDELRPVTNRSNYSWGGFGITLFDSLDTMLIMGLDDMYKQSRDFALTVDFTKEHDASVFEFTIRYVGGLLGAYEITRDRLLLFKAKELADRLLFAFNTTTGIPYSIVNLKTGAGRNPGWNGKSSILSEIGSIQLEFKYLSHYLEDPIYANKADNVYRILAQKAKNDKREGLYPVYVSPETGSFTSDLVSLGGLGDSYYEYLLKRYVLGGKSEPEFRELYDESMESVLANMVVESFSVEDNRTFTFLGEWRRSLVNEMDHLVCYVPGMLMLGAQGVQGAKHDLHVETAKQLVDSCYHTYSTMPVNIGPERVSFIPFKGENGKRNAMKRGFSVVSGKYLLRPETIESIFYMWRYTGEQKYRDWGWAIFEAIEKYCKTASSYSGLHNVADPNGEKNDSMPSYFFAETLKYLYLLFSDNDVVPLDNFVFTTEAHPLGILPPK